jgi:hypothetical protein
MPTVVIGAASVAVAAPEPPLFPHALRAAPLRKTTMVHRLPLMARRCIYGEYHRKPQPRRERSAISGQLSAFSRQLRALLPIRELNADS